MLNERKQAMCALVRDTRILLAGGIAFMALVTVTLILMRTEKEYVLAFSGFVGQLIAALLTWVTRQQKPNDNGNGGGNGSSN